MTLRERIEQLEPREQRLLGMLLGVFGVMLVLLVPVLVSAMISSSEEENHQIRAAIESIFDARAKIEKREREKLDVEARYARPAPPLASFLEKLATDLGVEVSESQDRPVVPHGKRFEERSTKVVLNRIGMFNLVTLMERLENSGHPVRISSMNIRKRPTDNDSFDVNLTVSAFDRKAAEKPKKLEKEGSETTKAGAEGEAE